MLGCCFNKASFDSYWVRSKGSEHLDIFLGGQILWHHFAPTFALLGEHLGLGQQLLDHLRGHACLLLRLGSHSSCLGSKRLMQNTKLVSSGFYWDTILPLELLQLVPWWCQFEASELPKHLWRRTLPLWVEQSLDRRHRVDIAHGWKQIWISPKV